MNRKTAYLAAVWKLCKKRCNWQNKWEQTYKKNKQTNEEVWEMKDEIDKHKTTKKK